MRLDERGEHRAANGLIEAPQPPRLLHGQSEAWHLEKLSADTPDEILDSPNRLSHSLPLV